MRCAVVFFPFTQAAAAQITGVPADLLAQMRANVLAALQNDTASISGRLAHTA